MLRASDIAGSFSVIDYEPINLSSAKQMKELLSSLGWKPTQWNYKKDDKKTKTSPKLTEDSYDSLPEGLGQKLAQRLKCEHRKHQIEGLLKAVRKDGRIEAQANPCGTNTGRMTHKVVVNIPKADPNVFLGKEMRELFTVREHRILVGCDASSLEWRIAAHYINHPTVTQLVTEGDIHEYINRISGVNNRNVAKQLGFGILYGAGAGRVAIITGYTPKRGARIREKIIGDVPGLSKLINRIQHIIKQRKFLLGLDGRKIFIRSEHSALNALIQSGGAIAMKHACVIANERVRCEKLDAFQIGFFHDEFVFECDPKIAEKMAEILKESIREAGRVLKLKCPLDAKAKIGRNWAEIH